MTQVLIALRFVALALLRAVNGVAGIARATLAQTPKVWRALERIENRIERRVDRFVDTGWRRAFGWLGFAVGYFSYIHAPLNGISVDYNAVNIFLTFSTGTFVVRGVEKHLRDRLGLPGPESPMGPGAAAGLA